MSDINQNNNQSQSRGDDAAISLNLNDGTNSNRAQPPPTQPATTTDNNTVNDANDETNNDTQPRPTAPSPSKTRYARKNKRRVVGQNYVYLNPLKRQIKSSDIVKPAAAKGKQVLRGVHVDKSDEHGDIAFFVLLSGEENDDIDEEKYQTVKECEVTTRMLYLQTSFFYNKTCFNVLQRCKKYITT